MDAGECSGESKLLLELREWPGKGTCPRIDGKP